MKIKPIDEIKHGKRVFEMLPMAFNDICRLTGLDNHTAQKVLANLSKNGYVLKQDGAAGLWTRIEHGQEESNVG